MRRLVYLGDKNCPPCRRYKREVMDPLSEKYPGCVEVHPEWDARFAKADALIPVRQVPTIIVEKDGNEEFRFSAMLEAAQLESIITHEGDVLTAEDLS